MTKQAHEKRTWAARGRAGAASILAAASLAGCGGGSNPFDNPDSVNNAPTTAGQTLAFAYFQKCIQPILLARSCAASGCHDNNSSTGGALRLRPGAAQIDLSNTAITLDVIRTSDMYKTFVSSQASAIVGASAQSMLLRKPLVQGTLHGGGVIFGNNQDPDVKVLEYWINRPVPLGQDELSPASYSMFTPTLDPANAAASICNTQ